MKQAPIGSMFITKEMPKAVYLQDILGRLQNEVGTYLTYATSVGGTGYWSAIRLLMPVIETVAHLERQTPQGFLERHLNAVTPHLVWDLFRNALSHNDIPHYATYGSRRVNWGVGLNGRPHRFEIAPQWIYIDGVTLYNDLGAYLEREITANDLALIDIEVGVNYLEPKKGIRDDFYKL